MIDNPRPIHEQGDRQSGRTDREHLAGPQGEDAGSREMVEKLTAILLPMGKIAVALSGGVDSSVLLTAAAGILGPDRVLALSVQAPMVPVSDRLDVDLAVEISGSQLVRIILPEVMLEQEPFTNNPPDRCYHCKKLIFSEILTAAHQRGFTLLCDGTNADDLQAYRPGLKALEEFGVRSPLAEAGLTKQDIRKLAKVYCPHFAEKPAMACLATRIPHGTAITLAAMQRIDRAEESLRRAGYAQVRVRDHHGLARVEVAADLLEQGLSSAQIRIFRDILHEAGFVWSTFDLDGYRTGSMQDIRSAN